MQRRPGTTRQGHACARTGSQLPSPRHSQPGSPKRLTQPWPCMHFTAGCCLPLNFVRLFCCPPTSAEASGVSFSSAHWLVAGIKSLHPSSKGLLGRTRKPGFGWRCATRRRALASSVVMGRDLAIVLQMCPLLTYSSRRFPCGPHCVPFMQNQPCMASWALQPKGTLCGLQPGHPEPLRA